MKKITEGTICFQEADVEYQVAKIEYSYQDDEEEEYVFHPYYNVIDFLPASLFQGIPGLDLDLRKKEYKRNSVPVFLSERTPGKNRVDLEELLKKYGMTYWNRLEWLIRTEEQYFGDNLYVKRYQTPKTYTEVTDLTRFNYQDRVEVESIMDIGSNTETILKILRRIVASSATLSSKEIRIDESNRKDYFHLLYALNKKAFDSGVLHKRGRKRVGVDFITMCEVQDLYSKKRISRDEAMKRLGISTLSTFYRRMAEFEKSTKE